MSAKRVKPRIRLVAGEWYAFAPNNSAMARALLAKAISVLGSWNTKRRADARKAARRIGKSGAA